MVLVKLDFKNESEGLEIMKDVLSTHLKVFEKIFRNHGNTEK
jgi:hypothetical protein